MITLQFLAEWALRSSILILAGALLLKALRVKDPSTRLVAWTVMLFGSLAIPALTAALPKLPLAVTRAPSVLEAPVLVYPVALGPVGAVARSGVNFTGRVDWARTALMVYVLVALALLLRLCVGLAMSLRLLRGSRATGRATEGIEIRESDQVAAPVTLGIVRPAIVLPGDWRPWDVAKLDAVLAHERSHIRRRDPALQLLSAIHRALLWHSPLSWFLHRRIVRAAEEASDDAAVAVTRDRALYAEVLLDFIRRGVRRASWLGVPMARYGRADQRIQRILDGTALSRGVTRWSVAAILTLGSPLAYLVAAAHPQSAAPAQAAVPKAAPQLNYASGNDGYLMHRGTTDRNISAFMTIGGISLQEKAVELRSRIRNFVLIRRHEKAYLIEDPETVRRALNLLDDANSCRESVDAATPFVDELQKALEVCKISKADLAAGRKLKETQKPFMEQQNVIEIVMDSRIWSALDLSISNGIAHPIEP